MPVISNVPKDHHSLLQLYLDGPKDKLFNIFSCEEKSYEKINMIKIEEKLSFLNKKKVSAVKNSQKQALKKSFKKKLFHLENSLSDHQKRGSPRSIVFLFYFRDNNYW